MMHTYIQAHTFTCQERRHCFRLCKTPSKLEYCNIFAFCSLRERRATVPFSLSPVLCVAANVGDTPLELAATLQRLATLQKIRRGCGHRRLVLRRFPAGGYGVSLRPARVDGLTAPLRALFRGADRPVANADKNRIRVRRRKNSQCNPAALFEVIDFKGQVAHRAIGGDFGSLD